MVRTSASMEISVGIGPRLCRTHRPLREMPVQAHSLCKIAHGAQKSCEWCEPPKTEADVHEKSRVYRKRLRHAGIRLTPKGRPLPGTFASGWKHRMDGG
jgi:hypothetical protein